jgi:trimeric autotransporter adhesin
MKNFISAFMMLVLSVSMMAQSPNAFNYQAVLRDAGGNIIPDRNIALRISILQGSESGTVLYSERHTKQTSNLGLFHLEIGTGSVVSGSFASINWGIASHFLKIEVDVNAGTSYTHFGTSKMLAVPYALYANQLSYLQLDPVNQSVSLQAVPAAASDDPIFEIKNKDGLVMLGVYNEGVRINVLEEEIKGSKSGFAVGSFSRDSKGDPSEVMRLTSDSVRFYIPDAPDGKSSKGGFAVGSFSRDAKGAYYNILDLSPEKARIYIDQNTSKGSKGGFAVGSFSRDAKADETEFMNISPLNYFIGHSAGASNTDGVYNSVMGFESAKNNLTGSYNSFFGYKTGHLNTSGQNNVFIGNESGYSNLVGSSNVFLGFNSGYYNTASFNTFLGYQAGKANSSGQYNAFLGYNAGLSNTTGGNNVFIGNESGRTNTAGSNNVFLGYFSGYANTASDNVFLGFESGRNNTTGTRNAFMGYQAGLSNTQGNSNVFIGNGSGYTNTTGGWNTFMGFQAGYSNNANYNSFIGYQAGRANTGGAYNSFMGYNAGLSNTTGASNVFIGNEAGRSNISGASNVFLGNQAGYSNTSSNNVFLGFESGRQNSSGTNNAFMGYQAGRANTSGSSNVYIGNNTSQSSTISSQNVAIGNNSASDVTSVITSSVILGDNALTGMVTSIPVQRSLFIGKNAGIQLGQGSTLVEDCIFLGTNAGQGIRNTEWSTISSVVALGNNSGLNSNGYRNVFIGNGAGTDFTGHQNTMIGFLVGTQGGSGTYNVFLGDQAALQANGDNNTYIGRTSGTWVNGSNNVFIGFSAGAAPFNNPRTESNRLRIGSANLIYGEFDNQRVGINATNPTTTLDVNGQVRVRTIGSGAYSTNVNRTADGTLTTATSDIRMKENISTLHGSLDAVLRLRGVYFTWKTQPGMGTRIGFIAQEVESILPELVFTNEADGYKGVQYSEMTAVLVEAMKEQQQQIDQLKNENQELRKQTEKLASMEQKYDELLKLIEHLTQK